MNIHFMLESVTPDRVNGLILLDGPPVGSFSCRLDVARILGAMLRGEPVDGVTVTMDPVA